MDNTAVEVTGMSKARWKPRWWQLVIFALVFLVLAVFTTLMLMRSNGRAWWQAYVADEQALGHPVTIDDAIALAPPVVLSIQTEWTAWSKFYRIRGAGPTSLFDTLKPHLSAWEIWVAGRGPYPDQLAALIAGREKDMVLALDLLRTGQLVLCHYGLSTVGAARHDHRIGTQPDFPDAFAVTELATWLRHHAVLSDDPGQDLMDLNALSLALAKPTGHYDVRLALRIGKIRDCAFLELAVRHALPPDLRDRWLSESCRYLEMFGAAMIGSRIQMTDGQSFSLSQGFTTFVEEKVYQSGGWQWSHWETISTVPYQWFSGWGDLPRIDSYLSRIGGRLRGDHHDAISDPAAFGSTLHESHFQVYFRYSLFSDIVSTLDHDAFFRQARLSVRILDLARHGKLPADQADLLGRLGDDQALQGGSDRRMLIYERLSPDRFRMAIDPASPITDFDTLPPSMKLSGVAGSPPSTKPLSISEVSKSAFVEIQVPPIP